jgi:hypothetical protein
LAAAPFDLAADFADLTTDFFLAFAAGDLVFPAGAALAVFLADFLAAPAFNFGAAIR